MMENTYHIGLEAGLILSLQQLAPVNAVEEVVRLDLGGALGSQTLLCVAVEEAGQKVACSGGDDLGPREMQRLSEDLAVHVVGVLVVKGWKTCQHLVEEDTECPPIYRLCVSAASEEFRGQVLGCSAKC